jgi:hypothetical protein
MASVRIKGGPELKARLSNIVASAAAMEAAWADDAASRIAGAAPRRTGALAGSIKPGTKSGKGAVFGNWYGIIQDRGTSAYSISPKNASVLKFEYRGRTVFAKKAQRKRLRRRPFITANAQDALRSAPMADQIIKAWNRRSSRGRFSRLSL